MSDLLIKAPVTYELLIKNRFLLRFPSDLGIQEWWVLSCSRPGITQNSVEIPFMNTSNYVIGRYNWEEINVDTWRALTELYESGRVKAIGVSNFKPHHLDALMQCGVKPMVNQIEFHPGQMQEEIRDYCRGNDIVVEAYSPLGRGKMLENETLQSIAAHYDKTTAQLCLRWTLQHNVIPIVKSVTPSRMLQNTEIFDFEISREDMAAIDAIPYFGGSGMDPDTVEW